MRKLFLILMTVLVCSWSAAAQSRTYHGTVVDAANQEPLIGATIMPIGGGNGAAADIDGNFTITVPANVKKATVSYVGYTSKTVELSNNMHIELASSATSLDDVIVVAYGTANKESLTGSVSVVGAKEIEERPVTTVTAALEGNAPGVQVNNTVGNPGSEPSIRIRGFNSVTGNSSPLIVVDGVEYSGSIADLNPADIESMSVLKDAASAALYGAKGANGVVLITTKRAKSVGKVDVNLQVSQGFYELGLPLYDRLGANEWMQYAFNGVINGAMDYRNPTFTNRQDAIDFYRNGNFINEYAQLNIYGLTDANGNVIQGLGNDQLFDAAGMFLGKDIIPGYMNDRDWWSAVTQTGHRQEYNLNAAGATEKFNIFASIGYLKENGYMLRTDFERFNGRLNANFEPTSYLRLGVNLAAAQQDSDQEGSESGSNEDPFMVNSIAPIFPYYEHNPQTGEVIYRNGQPVWNTSGGYLSGSNPPYSLRLDKTGYTATLIDANVYGTAIIPYGFELTVRGSMHRDKTISTQYMNNRFGSALAANGLFYQSAANSSSYQFFQTLNWSHDYGDNHVDVLLNHENSAYDNDGFYVQMGDQMFADVMNMQNFTKYYGAGGSAVQERTESYLGRVRYNYDQKYFGEVSLRRDGSSRFAKENRWGTFWSVGASWVISKEKFMMNAPWVDYLKLRTAYGAVGNNNVASAYAYWPLYAPWITYGKVYGTLVPVQIPASNIHWESTKTFDIGLDGTLFNDRLNFSIGYFDKRNADLLFPVTMPASSGSLSLSGNNPSVTANIGTMSNHGWEISINGDIIRNKDLTWSASIDATFLKNKLVSLPYGRDIVGSTQIYQEGLPMYQWYMPQYAGVDRLTGDALYVINPESHEFYDAETGTYSDELYKQRLADADAQGELVQINGKYYSTVDNFGTKEYCGIAIPVVYGSFGTALSWKGIHLNVLFTYSLGGKTYDSNYQSYMTFSATPGAMHVDLKNSWTEADAEGITADSPNRIDPNGIPMLSTTRYMQNNGTSSRFLTPSDYLVLKNINLSYDLPQKWVSALKLQNINIGCSIDNLFTLTARRGMNPQQSWSGGQGMTYGTARVITFQIGARF